MSENRRSAIPQPGLSRRAPSPSNAAFSSRGSVTGPLGSYRPASRDGTEKSTSDVDAATIANAPSRFGFSNGASLATASTSKTGSAKRTHSIAGLKEPETPGPNGSAAKRILLTSASLSATSPRFPATSPSYDASKLKSEYERRELLSKQAYEKLQNEYKASGREIERYKQEKLTLLRQWEDANAERKEEKENLEEQRKFLNERVNQLTSQNEELKLKLEEVQSEKSQLAQNVHEEETKQLLRISSLEFELASAKANAEENKERKEKMELALKSREKEWEEERNRTTSSERDDRDSKKVTLELSELLSRIHRLESETLVLQRDNRILKTRSESIEALKEQNRMLEEKVGVVDAIRRKLAEAESHLQDMIAEKEQWDSKLTNGGDTVAFESMQGACSTVDAEIPAIPVPQSLDINTLPTYISSLQGAISGLTVRSKVLSERVDGLRNHQVENEKRYTETINQLRKALIDSDNEKLERLKAVKRAEAAKVEVESYVKLLDTFQEESKNQSAQYNAASAEHIRMLETRIKTLTEASEEAKIEIERLTRLTQEGGGMSKEERETIQREHETLQKELRSALEESQKQYAELEAKCIELGRMNDDLFLRVGRGEFDQTKLRCLELKDNPVTQDRIIRSTTLQALKQENKELLERLEELSKKLNMQGEMGENDSTINAMVPVQTLENQRREYEKLEETMKNRDKAFDRLKQAFAAKATEYVAAVKALFGYDMHVISKGKVKIRSVYARTAKGTSLTFESGEDGNAGNMKLIGEARQGVAVGTLQEYWLGNDRFSVPCFLAALQLELYEGTTRALRGTWEAEQDE